MTLLNPFTLKSHLFEGQELVFNLIPQEEHGKFDIDRGVINLFPHIKHIIRLSLRNFDGIKFKIQFNCTMIKITDQGELMEGGGYFNSDFINVYNDSQIHTDLWQAINIIIDQMIRYCLNGSGWTFQSIDEIVIKVLRFSPVNKCFAGSYLPLPPSLLRKSGLINIRNTDNFCFIWCILLHIHILVTGEKTGKKLRDPRTFYEYLKYINISGLRFPVEIVDVIQFERINNISVNIFTIAEDERIVPHYVTKSVRPCHINLLLITQGNQSQKHFVYINSLSNLLGKMGSKAKFFCNQCFRGLVSEEKKINHELNCGKQFNEKIEMPIDGEKLYFHNYQNLMKAPFVIYLDLEAFPIQVNSNNDNNRDKCSSYTSKYQTHEPYSYGVMVIDFEQKIVHQRIFRGENSIENLIDHLFELYEILDMLKRIDYPMTFNEEDQISFQNSTNCWLCEKPFVQETRNFITNLSYPSVKDLIKCRHHCHLTSKYIGATHSLCNLQLKYKNRAIPVISHNFKNYDSHLILSGINREINVDVIPSNSEHYVSVTFDNKLKFIDSFQFLPSALSDLIHELPVEEYKIVPQAFEKDFIKYVTGKGVFPYDYVTNFKTFNEKSLPSKEKFYNSLNESDIDEEEYKRAVEIWESFNIKTIGEFSDFYLFTDVILLAEVFENFRSLCIESHRLDPVHYISCPGYTWDAMLRRCSIPISLISDQSMYQFIESGIRGGIAMVAKRYAEANNPYMNHLFQKDKETSYIMYYDFVNLYGWAMSMKMPYADFKFLEDKEINEFMSNISEIDPNGDNFYALEVDLEYPESLHDVKSHNDLPLAVDKRVVTYEMLSDYQKQILSDFPDIHLSKTPKLIPSFLPKKNYVCHLTNLKMYIEKGLKITKVHRILTAIQAAFLEPYITFNSSRRSLARFKFEITFYKNLNNFLFGKCLQGVRNHLDVKVIASVSQVKKYAKDPRFFDFREINDKVSLFLMKKTKVKLDKPIFIGFTVLELSKVLVYSFHYNYIGVTYGNNSSLLNMDTDGLIYHIQTPDVYSDMQNNLHIFDTSDYPKDNILYSNYNKKRPGTIKDEKNSLIITSCASPKAKMISLEILNPNMKIINHKRCKGIKKYVINNKLNHSHFSKAVLNQILTYAKMNTFRSKNHKIGSYTINKIGLHSFDDKRYLYDSINSLSYGHYKLM